MDIRNDPHPSDCPPEYMSTESQPSWTVVKRFAYLAQLFDVPEGGRWTHHWRSRARQLANYEEALVTIADHTSSAHEAQEIARDALGDS
jgi:hypothetical protein